MKWEWQQFNSALPARLLEFSAPRGTRRLRAIQHRRAWHTEDLIIDIALELTAAGTS